MNKSFLILLPLFLLLNSGCSTTSHETSSDTEFKKHEIANAIALNEKIKNLKKKKESKTNNFNKSNEIKQVVKKNKEIVLKKNIFERITSKFSMKNLRSRRVQTSVKRLVRDPEYVERVFKRSAPYLHHIVEELSKRNMPMELALLPFVESAYRTSATSSARAAGLWQFIPVTGRRFGLKQNWWVDERRDVVKSTQAALDYLELLHKMMGGDWFLALAAYNWGEASVRKAIRKNKARKKKTGYLYLRMPRETRYYVPKLLAVKEIVLNPKKYNINIPFIADEPYFEQIRLYSSIDFEILSEMSEVDASKIKEMNAVNLRPVINAKHSRTALLPLTSISKYSIALEKYNDSKIPLVSWTPYTFQKGDTLQTVSKKHDISVTELASSNGIRVRNKYLKGTNLIVPARVSSKQNLIAELDNFVRPKLIRPRGSYWPNYHKVRRGESLSTIAKKYRTTIRKIKNLNNLNSNLIFAGQKLKIYLNSRNYGIHQVKRGDSLYSIAIMYRTTVSELKRINKLASDIIRIGSKLVIK